MRIRRCKFWNEMLTDASAVRWADGRRVRGIGQWIEKAIRQRIREGMDPMAVELWVRTPRRRDVVS